MGLFNSLILEGKRKESESRADLPLISYAWAKYVESYDWSLLHTLLFVDHAVVSWQAQSAGS